MAQKTAVVTKTFVFSDFQARSGNGCDDIGPEACVGP